MPIIPGISPFYKGGNRGVGLCAVLGLCRDHCTLHSPFIRPNRNCLWGTDRPPQGIPHGDSAVVRRKSFKVFTGMHLRKRRESMKKIGIMMVPLAMLVMDMGLTGCGSSKCKEEDCDKEVYKDGCCEYHYALNVAGEIVSDAA